MRRIITTKCARRAQKDNDDIITLAGGSVQGENGVTYGFISFLPDLGIEDKVEVTEIDPTIAIQGSDSINYIYLDDEYIILVGTKDGGKPYASRLLINDNHTADITQFSIADISVIRKTLPFHVDNNAYVSIGDKEFDTGATSSVVSLFDNELNQKKTITTIDSTSGEALLVSLYGIIIYGENIFVGGVIHPTVTEYPRGVIIKLDKELNVVSYYSIISESVSKATVVRTFDIIDDTLIAIIEIRDQDNGEPSMLMKKFDMDLREILDPEVHTNTMGTVQ
jgi:hypothetical protein